ncbi:uncharacterized protein LOC121536140 [Coregonus clupeaformis]|uniref:uncharacterized protein LOC121536140 n=1 Tax=Coregonus clupeaformis TaxID=59861 RepID=UPI001E1C7026|nr:uncharacterized protein LOC121536140 [Coregonus clupeaformis]
MWTLYSKYPTQKDRPELFSEEEKEIIKKAYSSVRRWLHTPVTHITSVQMKRFRKYIVDKEQQPQASTSKCDPSSWPGDDSELLAASQAVEDTIKQFEPPVRPKQPEPAVRPKKPEPAVRPKQPEPPVRPKKLEPAVRPKKPEPAVRPKQPEPPVRPKQPEPPGQLTESPSTAQDHEGQPFPTESPLSDSPVELEGWVRLWENPNGIPSADISWLKDHNERGLFTPVQIYKDKSGLFRRRRVMKSDRMWFYPEEPPGYVRVLLKCPRGDQCLGRGRNVHLYKSGYHHRVRHICDVSTWYTMLTEVLCCGPCTKAARSGEGGTMGRWLAWDAAILSQLSEAHQAMFPAILTSKRGVDRTVVRLLRDRTEGNTMVKVWRQIQENHVEEYLQRKDLYTTLLMTVVKPGGIVSALRHTFQAPPPPRELPSARLLRHAFLLAEANNVQDYRSQILSTFGTVLKMDSTKKVVKKLSGEGGGSAEWFTSIGNEHSQIVSFVLTCEESTEKLKPMCLGVMERFRLANQPVPKIIYVDRGCCRAQGPTALGILFQPWVDNGMVVRLDIFHWIHRFDAAIRTESHSKYAAFKSALAGGVLAYNRSDLELLIKAMRAKDPATLMTVSDEDIVRLSTLPGSTSNTTCEGSHWELRKHSGSSIWPLRS